MAILTKLSLELPVQATLTERSRSVAVRHPIATVAMAALSLAGCTSVGRSGRTNFPHTGGRAYVPEKTQTQQAIVNAVVQSITLGN